jgi:uncharacterized membrane protein
MSEPDRKPKTPPATGAPLSHGGPWSRLRNYFLTGLVLVGPIYITVNLTWWLINWVDDLMRPFIPVSVRTETYLPFHVPGVGLIVALSSLTLLGFLTANLVGRTLVEFGEDLLNRMPIVRPIYKTIKQIFETLFSNSGSSFRTVALVEFPAGMWSLVFLSQPPGSDVASRLPGGGEFVSAFLPCTPNPTTGFFFYVPRRDIIELDITVEAAMTLLMSAGMAQPGGADQQKRLAAIAESALLTRPPQTTPPTAPAK